MRIFLYRELLTEHQYGQKPSDTHLISVEARVGNHKYSTDVRGLYPKELRKVYAECLVSIMKVIDEHNKVHILKNNVADRYAVEFGFKQHEKGNNLQYALANWDRL